MNTSLTRNVPYWLLVIVSAASAAVGGWLISGQIGTMATALIEGTATGIEVYVGQSMVVVGAALLGAGVLGILLALVLAAAKTLLRAPTPVVETVDQGSEPEPAADADAAEVDEEDPAATPDATAEADTVPAGEPALTK